MIDNRAPRWVAAMWVLTAGVATAADEPVKLNDTGAVYCLTAAGTRTLACAGSQQDAGLGRDATRNDPSDGALGFSYAKVCHSGARAGSGDCPADPPPGPNRNEWGCTLDKVSGRLWELKTKSPDRHWHKTYTNYGDHRYGDASTFVLKVNAQGLCGHRDWRLPSVHELMSLVHYGNAPSLPAADTDWFPETTAWTWSSTPVAGYPNMAWMIQFHDGFVETARHDELMAVRLVRGGRQAQTAAPRHVVRDTEVLDTATGLIWRRCIEGTVWDGATCHGTPPSFRLPAALDIARSAAADTGKPWRLPNVKELYALLDLSRSRPALDPAVFPSSGVTRYDHLCSSTLHTDDEQYPWQVDYFFGNVPSEYSRDSDCAVRLVRKAPRPPQAGEAP